MPQVSISEAARLTGKSRATIHRHIESGKISKGLDGLGNPVVDVSELERVYGVIQVGQVSHPVASDSSLQGEDVAETGVLQAEIRMLREQMASFEHLTGRERETLARQIDDLRQDRDHWREEAAKWERQAATSTRLLENHSQKPPEKPAERPSWFGRLFGAGNR